MARLSAWGKKNWPTLALAMLLLISDLSVRSTQNGSQSSAQPCAGMMRK